MMITFLAEPTDRGAHVGVRLIVFIVPHQVTGDANLVRLASGRSKTVVGQSQERRCVERWNIDASELDCGPVLLLVALFPVLRFGDPF
jgi:hypothetical protein